MKPIIGITAHIMIETDPIGHELFGHSHIGNTYVTSISQAGGVPIILPAFIDAKDRQDIVDLCDGFLFAGGLDMSPSLYDEDVHPKLNVTNLKFDHTQINLMKKVMEAKKPILAICRGSQVMNVACGGSLYQDVSESPGSYIKHSHETGNADGAHRVFIDKDSKLYTMLGEKQMVNSYHHQSIKRLGENIKAVAYAADGIVEGIELQDYPFGIGVQWHPEAMYAFEDESMKPLFDAFIKASI